jgi:hypothetical protein
MHFLLLSSLMCLLLLADPAHALEQQPVHLVKDPGAAVQQQCSSSEGTATTCPSGLNDAMVWPHCMMHAKTEPVCPAWQSHLSVCVCFVCPVLCCAQAYEELTKKLRELDALNGISGLLGWDELVSYQNTTLRTATLRTALT